MIICRTPFRISYFGGGTDFPSWYNKNNGLVISTTINKYCFLTLRTLPPILNYNYRLRYFTNEHVNKISEIKHPSIKAVLKLFHTSNTGLELIHNADLPALSGLGASSAFTVSLINAIQSHNFQFSSKRFLAENAILIEQKKLKENVGSQDQFACAFGGFNIIEFNSNKISLSPIIIGQDKIKILSDSTVLMFTEITRFASNIEKDKLKNMNNNYKLYEEIYSIANQAKKILYSNSKNFVAEIGKLLNENWRLKKELSSKVSNKKIDNMYTHAMNNGAIGGKLLGAGSGGFMMFITKNKKDKKKLISSFKNKNIIKFDFEYTGSQIIYNNSHDDYN